MRLTFIPLDYDYFSSEGRTYIRIFGKTSEGKSCCVIDETENFFYILSKNPENLLKEIKKIKEVEKFELEEKNFLGKPVKAIRIYSQTTDFDKIKHKIDLLDENTESKERDINIITRYIIEKKIKPL